jgi:hypothetical protein
MRLVASTLVTPSWPHCTHTAGQHSDATAEEHSAATASAPAMNKAEYEGIKPNCPAAFRLSARSPLLVGRDITFREVAQPA